MKSLALFLLIFLVGCSAKGPKTAVNTSFSFTGALTALDSQTGGIILYGRNKADFSDAFITVINTSSQQMRLANGNWEFKAVSWTGYNSSLGSYGNPMEGQVRCAHIPNLSLSGTDTDLNLVLSTANCQGSDFGSADTQGPNGPKPSKFYSCSNVEALSNNQGKNDPIKCFNSIGNSFQVVLMGRRLDGVMKEVYSSRCIANDNSTTKTQGILDSINPHELRLPIFFPDYPGPAWKVKVFEDGGCTKQSSRSTFVHPYADEFVGAKAHFKSNQMQPENIFMVYTPVCGTVAGAQATPFVSHLNYTDPQIGPVNKSYSVICKPDQMATFMTNNLALNYKLGANIDFAGATFTDAIVRGTLTGKFDGAGKRISNFNITATILQPTTSGNGLFAAIDGTSATPANPVGIANLYVDSVTINCSNASNVGAVVGLFKNGATIDNVHVSKVSISNSSCDYVGGIGGKGSSSGDVTNVSMNGLNLDLLGGSVNYQGGGFGFLSGNAGVGGSLINSQFSNIRFTQSGALSSVVGFGGVLGSMQNSFELSDISASQIRLGSTSLPLALGVGQVGGAFGYLGGVNNIRNINVKSEIHTNAGTSSVGGVIGKALGNGAISNLVSNSTIVAGGLNVGGVIGFSGTNSSVRSLRSFGSLLCQSNCGGIVGDEDGGSAYSLLYSAMTISPYTSGISASNIGGVFGLVANASGAVMIRSIQNDGMIDFTNATSAVRIGGAIGYYTGANTSSSIDTVINHGDVIGNATVSTAGSIGVGGILGYINNDTSLSLSRYLNTGNISNLGAGAAYHFLGGYTDTGTVGTYDIGGDVLYSSGSAAGGKLPGLLGGSPLYVSILGVDPTSLTGLTGFNATMLEGDGINPLDLKSVYRLKQLGGVSRTGNRHDPFFISTAAQWNMVEDLEFFMGSNFQLAANLDFTGVTFRPMGSFANPFQGTLRGNGFGLDNISMAPTVVDRGAQLDTVGAAATIGSSTLTALGAGFTGLVPGDQLEIVDATNGSVYVTVQQVINTSTISLQKSIEVGVAANSPIYRAHERNFGIFAATKYANINSGYDESDTYSSWLYIRNLNANILSSSTASGPLINVGGVIGHAMRNNYLSRISIENSNITAVLNSFDGGNIGGLVGYFDLTSDYANYVYDIEISNSYLSQSGGSGTSRVGGIFGLLDSKKVSTGATHQFMNMRVSDTSLDGDQVGGIAGEAVNDTFSQVHFNKMLASSSLADTFTSTATSGAAGGIFAFATNLNLSTYSVSGLNITTSNGSAGGIVAKANPGTSFKGGYVTANINGGTGNAGCLIGATGSIASSVTLQNSYAMCGSVTGTASSSYAVGSPTGLVTTANDVFYIGANDANAVASGMINITRAQLSDETFMNSAYPLFKSVDPWIWPKNGGVPLPYYEIFPQYFFD